MSRAWVSAAALSSAESCTGCSAGLGAHRVDRVEMPQPDRIGVGLGSAGRRRPTGWTRRPRARASTARAARSGRSMREIRLIVVRSPSLPAFPEPFKSNPAGQAAQIAVPTVSCGGPASRRIIRRQILIATGGRRCRETPGEPVTDEPPVVRAAGARRRARHARGGPAPSRRRRTRRCTTTCPTSQDTPRLLRRISGLHTEEWQNHFSSIANDAILVNVNDRVLHYWGSDGFYRIYPTSVPLTEEMTRRGRTTITLKRPDPDWRPTAAMLQRSPDLPALRAAGAGQPARHPSTEPRLAVLPHPRHQRHPQDRPAVVLGLHRAFQRAHPRGVRPGADRNAGVANLTTPVIYWGSPAFTD